MNSAAKGAPTTEEVLPSSLHQELKLAFGLILVSLLWGATTPFIRLAAKGGTEGSIAENEDKTRSRSRERNGSAAKGSRRTRSGKKALALSSKGGGATGSSSRTRPVPSNNSRSRTRTPAAKTNRLLASRSSSSGEQPVRTDTAHGSVEELGRAHQKIGATQKRRSSHHLTWRRLSQILLNARFYLPYLLNQVGSVCYYFLLGEFDVKIMVPAANGLALAVTGITEFVLQHRCPGWREVAGILSILLGFSLCVASTAGES
ncbi:unnamed protein product [Amoebophrya sp. A120]|nr:unnamed protein product [Amoebophrya sp. A120]|eukprot:GSA120T00002451001.1